MIKQPRAREGVDVARTQRAKGHTLYKGRGDPVDEQLGCGKQQQALNILIDPPPGDI